MKRVMLHCVYIRFFRLAFRRRLELGDGLLYKDRAVYIKGVRNKEISIASSFIISESRQNQTPYKCVKYLRLLEHLLLNVQ